MSILVNKNTKLAVQGAAGAEAQSHLKVMLKYGTNVVAGVVPAFKTDSIEGVSAYRMLKDAIEKYSPNTSIIFVPVHYAFDAIMEAVYYGIKTIVVITEGIPVHDMIKVKQYIRNKDIHLIGPNCPGVISPDESKVGIMPGHIHKKGNTGVVSRSGKCSIPC